MAARSAKLRLDRALKSHNNNCSKVDTVDANHIGEHCLKLTGWTIISSGHFRFLNLTIKFNFVNLTELPAELTIYSYYES